MHFQHIGKELDVRATESMVEIFLESTARENKKLTTRLRNARFRQSACIEEIDYQHPRGLAKAAMLDLASLARLTNRRR